MVFAWRALPFFDTSFGRLGLSPGRRMAGRNSALGHLGVIGNHLGNLDRKVDIQITSVQLGFSIGIYILNHVDFLFRCF